MSLSLIPVMFREPCLMFVSLKTATGYSSGISIAIVSFPNEYTIAPLKLAHSSLIISIAGSSSEIITSSINLLCLIAVPEGSPIWFSRIVVNCNLGLCLNEPSANPSTPVNLPVTASHASQY